MTKSRRKKSKLIQFTSSYTNGTHLHLSQSRKPKHINQTHFRRISPNAYLCKKFPESVAFHFSPFLPVRNNLFAERRTNDKKGSSGTNVKFRKTFVYVFIMLLPLKSCSNRIRVGFVMKRVAARRMRKQNKTFGCKICFEFIIYVKLKLNNFVPEGKHFE